MMKRLLIGAAAALASSAALCATMIPSSMINWVSVPTWPSVSAGTVFAGPAAATGAPTFRALVSTDLPVVPVSKGGTNATAAGGTALDNITGFSGTGFLKRTGTGAYSFIADPLPVANGGTGAVTAGAARTALGAAASGANTDITSLSAPALGAATATTATAGDNTTKVATTAYVQSTVTGGANAASFTTIAASGLITPTSSIGIKGTTAGDTAAAGSIGEKKSCTFSSVTMTTSGTAQNMCNIPLTAGDWDAVGYISYTSGAGATMTIWLAGINTTSATLPAVGNYFQSSGSITATGAATAVAPLTSPNVTGAATIYLVGDAIFSGGSVTASGFMQARRVR